MKTSQNPEEAAVFSAIDTRLNDLEKRVAEIDKAIYGVDKNHPSARLRMLDTRLLRPKSALSRLFFFFAGALSILRGRT